MKRAILILAALMLGTSTLVGQSLRTFGIWIRADVFEAHPTKVANLALDMWADTDYEWKDDLDKVNVWYITVTEGGATGYSSVVTFDQLKGRVQERSNYWATVLSYPGVQWDVSWGDIYRENNLTIVGTWKNGVVE